MNLPRFGNLASTALVNGNVRGHIVAAADALDTAVIYVVVNSITSIVIVIVPDAVDNNIA